MLFNELVTNHDIKVVLLKDKRRITKKGNYGFFNPDGNVMVSRKTRKKFREIYTDIGILCQYIDDLGLYLSCLDIDVKDIKLVKKILERYPSSIEESKNGFHIFYLSTEPLKLKQLTGKEKERCKIDIRGQRDKTHDKEGNYVRVNKDAVIGNILECNFNDVIKYTYSLFGIEAKPIGEYEGDVKEWIGKPKMKKVTNKEKFIAYYLYYIKSDWSTGYPDAFPWGVRLKGALNEDEAYNIARFLMTMSGYPRPNKWIKAFMTGFTNANEGKPYFGKNDLKPEMKLFIGKRFNELGSEDLKELAKLLQDVKLYQVLEVICD